ncbi:AAA family ATPase [Streptomyces sp. NRRL B-24484]|uniref:AAA family ATPase n=1 Tax=Streptomyces sp. NRRL B-24484 TaxID=1463833 RepID=UPI000694D47E|nr:AAA family ATPase [Streptomyces sp. NRRL B-24484]
MRAPHPATAAAATTDGPPPESVRPRGVHDLRNQDGGPLRIGYPADAVVVVSGLPGSGKSTLLRRWSPAAPTVDPRTAHTACAAVMPTWLPYATYRPWARLRWLRSIRTSIRAGGPLLVHDCGSRSLLRRWIARTAARQGRGLHLVLLDVGAGRALAGQHSRGRTAPARTFARHRRGIARLLRALDRHGAAAAPECTSVLLLDGLSRSRATGVEFTDRQPR